MKYSTIVLTPSQMVLNWDVLLLVMAFMDGRSGTSRLMRTCRTLYQAGIPYLLGGVVTIGHSYTFVSLCKFMLSNAPYAFRYLRRLNLQAASDKLVARPPRMKALFSQLLGVAHCLEYLEFGDPVFLLADKRMTDSISRGLTGLREVVVRCPTPDAHKVLCMIPSSTRALDVDYTDHPGEPADCVSLLSPFADTLERLRVTDVLLEFRGPHVQYHNVITLQITRCTYVYTPGLYSTFPNLRSFTLWWTDEEKDMRDNEIEDLREKPLYVDEEDCWKSIDFLEGTVTGVCMLGLTTQVKHLSVNTTKLTVTYGRRLKTILADTTPSALSLTIDMWQFRGSSLGYYLSPAVRTLTALEIQLNFRGHKYADPSQPIIAMLATLSSFSIKLLRIWIRLTHKEATTAANGTTTHSAGDGRPRVPLQTLDISLLAEDVVQRIPSLQYIQVDAVGETMRGLWEFEYYVSQEGAKRLKPLPLGAQVPHADLFHQQFRIQDQ